MDDASVLPCREVQLVAGAAREEELTASWRAIAKPIKDRRSGLLSGPADRFSAEGL